MYNIILRNTENKYEYEELIKIFLNPDAYRLFTETELQTTDAVVPDAKETIVFNAGNLGDKNAVKREIYGVLSTLTGLQPEWGVLTGVRPVKMAAELFAETSDYGIVKHRLREAYFLHERKADLLIETLQCQQAAVGPPPRDAASVYIGIPFCPTRCLYCSFASNQVSEAEKERYLQALLREIAFCGQALRKKRLAIESLYVGGGTPTSLNESQLQRLLDAVTKAFDLRAVC